MISIFQLYKIGIGPSSSHTMGPMVAAARFAKTLHPKATRITVELFGSLAWTGMGHGSHSAICLGLLGHLPDAIDPDRMNELVGGVYAAKSLKIKSNVVSFDPSLDFVADTAATFPFHSNAMRFRALDDRGGHLQEEVYYSIGGGFVVREGDQIGDHRDAHCLPYPFASANELLAACKRDGLSIAELQFANELVTQSSGTIEAMLDSIAMAMFSCIDRGLRQEGTLPGTLKVRRRAKALAQKLSTKRNDTAPHNVMDWVSVYAIAVNEENASGGRVVTAPTNGAAGIVPAVLRYYRDFAGDYCEAKAREFLLTSAAFGSIIKQRASISGAEVGCQGEVGSAAAMAAAGLAAVMGGTPDQIENAAEIAMEHHLGMTCDPIGGLVQIPCIERNAFGAQKAIAAASLALHGDGIHHVSFDQVVETMRQTGADMQSKYKETSQGGLAVNVPEC